MISWPFFTILFSGWLYIDAAYRGPRWLYCFFHLITSFLLLILIWHISPYNISEYLIIIGLLIMIIADTWQIFFSKYIVMPIILLTCSFLIYSISFILQIKFIFFWQILILILLLIIFIFLWLYKNKKYIYICNILLFLISFLMIYAAIAKYFLIPEQNNIFNVIAVLFFFVANIINFITKFFYRLENSVALMSAFYLFGKLSFIYAMY